MVFMKALMRVVDEDEKYKRKMKRDVRKRGSKWRSLLPWNRNNKKNKDNGDNNVTEPTKRRIHNEVKVGLLSRLPQLDSTLNVRKTDIRSESFNILAVLGNDDSHSYVPTHLHDNDDVDYVVTNHGNLDNDTDHGVRTVIYENEADDEVDASRTSNYSLPVDQKIYEWTKYRQCHDDKNYTSSEGFSTRSILKSSFSLPTGNSDKQFNSVRFADNLSPLSSSNHHSPTIGRKDISPTAQSVTDYVTSPKLYESNGIASLKNTIKTVEYNTSNDRLDERRESLGTKNTMPSLVASSTSTPTTRWLSSSSSNPTIPKPKSIQLRQVSIQEHRLRSFSKYQFFRTMCDDAFDLVDIDQVGAIDEEEFYNGLLLIQLNLGIYLGSSACIKPISKAKAARLFNKIDHDHTGVIDKIDFREVMVVLLRTALKQLIFHWIAIFLLVPFLTCFVIDTFHRPISFIIQTFTIICNFFLGTKATTSSIQTIVSSSNDQPSFLHFVGIIMRSVGIVFQFMLDITPCSMKQSIPVIVTSIMLGMFFVPYIHSQINVYIFPSKTKSIPIKVD